MYDIDLRGCLKKGGSPGFLKRRRESQEGRTNREVRLSSIKTYMPRSELISLNLLGSSMGGTGVFRDLSSPKI